MNMLPGDTKALLSVGSSPRRSRTDASSSRRMTCKRWPDVMHVFFWHTKTQRMFRKTSMN